MLARVTLEILGAIPIADVEVETSVERPGQSVELLAGELRSGGRAVLRARAWRVLRLARRHAGGTAAARAARRGRAAAARARGRLRLRARDRVALGDRRRDARGPATVWTRLKVPIVEGEAPTPRQRVMAVADSGNGASSVLDWSRHLFINTELTVHFMRAPRGEWVCLDAETRIAVGGAGLATLRAQRRGGTGGARGAGAVDRAALTTAPFSFTSAPRGAP